MSLAGSNQITKVFIKIFNIFVHLVADMGVCLRSWCIVNIASIWKDAWIDGGHEAVSILGDFFLHSIRDTVR